jgi:glucosamine-6-phosphate deaminase
VLERPDAVLGLATVNTSSEHIHIPNGDAHDLKKECEQYDQAIDDAGGIDLQILGIGINGHIGFNEPGSSPEGRTTVVQLEESTVQANSRFFDSVENVPQQAISVGIGTILEKCKKIILLANGEEKAQAIKNMVDQEPNMANPASYLKLHWNVTIIVDEQAAKFITNNHLNKLEV